MENKLKIGTLNCRGLNNLEKILYLDDLLRINGIDICFLQETHLSTDLGLRNLEENLKSYNVFSNLSIDKSKGVAILVKSKLQVENFTFVDDRYIALDLVINKKVYNLVNIYAPNLISEQVRYIEVLDNIIFDKKNLILGGDFNCVDNSVLDRTGSYHTHATLKLNQKLWREFYKLHKISEIKYLHSDKKEMTWSNGTQASRIDRFYIKNIISDDMQYHSNVYCQYSDHKLVISELNFGNLHKIKKHTNSYNDTWKLNESVLDDEYVNQQIIEICKNISSLKVISQDGWYELFIGKITKLLKRESRRISKQKKERINFLFEKLNTLTRSSREGTEIIEIEKEIDLFYKEKRKGIELRACEVKRNFIYQPSKILLEKERNNGDKNLITKYKTCDDIITEDTDVMIKDLHKFYNELMGKDRVSDESIDKYLFNIKNLDEYYSERERDLFLNEEITFSECAKCIMNMKNSAPGPNGLTIGFFKKYFQYFGADFIEILNNKEKSLSQTFCRSIIRLIPKNKNSVKTVDDLRPISLTNLEYRIFTKILTNRLHKISDKLIGEHQTCSIASRRMSDNIILTRDLINHSNLRKKTLNIISVDQKKAFDSISHKYLFKLLKHLNLGEFMLRNILRLYEKSYSNIIINGIKSEKIKIESGIKQGCALSMMLYVLSIEELLLRIKKNEEIKGYTIKVLEKEDIKISAYADDVVGYVSDESSIKEFFCEFKDCGEVSGARLNDGKTKLLKLNNILTYKSDSEVENLKILGVIFNKSGVANSNLIEIKNKIIKCIYLWSNVDLDMLQRIVACKTFVLSKLWFIAHFIFVEEKFLKEINFLIFKFIWGNSIELVKRDTLILPIENGGLGMFHLKAKLETISMQQFNYISRHFKRVCYNMSVYWLKHKLRGVNFQNYNIIPEGSDDERPKIYSYMIECYEKYKKLNTNYRIGESILNSKIIYEKLRKGYEIRPKYESLPVALDWNMVNFNLMNKKLDSRLREINFKILNNCLSLNIKYSNRLRKNCVLCKKKTENLNHLFLECQKSIELFGNVRKLLKNNNLTLSSQLVYYSLNIGPFENKIISIYKLTLWQVRNFLRTREIDIDLIFSRFFNKNLIEYKINP